MSKLELKHLTPYLDYNLKVQYHGIVNGKEKSKNNKEHNLKCKDIDKNGGNYLDYPMMPIIDDIIDLKIGLIKRISIWNNYTCVEVGIKSMGLKKYYLSKFSNESIKPILNHPEDYLTKEIAIELGWVSLEDMIRGIKTGFFSYKDYLFFCENHIDFQGLIDKGFAISYNDLEDVNNG